MKDTNTLRNKFEAAMNGTDSMAIINAIEAIANNAGYPSTHPNQHTFCVAYLASYAANENTYCGALTKHQAD